MGRWEGCGCQSTWLMLITPPAAFTIALEAMVADLKSQLLFDNVRSNVEVELD